ncbi:MAG: hypothetical protein NTW33_10970 [Methanoregula sp.]|nr:hypothetical protein [Methanoregula sp.]
MTNQNEQVNLREGDLVLMNFAGIGETGPIFEFLENVGAADLTDEADTGAPQGSTSEHDTTGVASSRKLDIQGGVPGGISSQSLLSTLVEQRNTLSSVIRQLKQNATAARNEQSSGTVGRIPQQHSTASDNSSPKT